MQPRGLTLVELLAVSAILLMMAGTLGSLALSVQNTNHYQLSRGLSLQHGQVTMIRIQRHLQQATANMQFPGFVEFPTRVGLHSFPETLVVWHPATSPIDPTGRPRIHELVVFCPNPAAPHELWEITKPQDTRIAPPLANVNAWRTELDSFRQDKNAQRVVLTDLVRVASVQDNATKATSLRAALRFQVFYQPGLNDWADYYSGRIPWESMPFVQSISGKDFGLCQVRCQMEIQLRPGGELTNHPDAALPFFGSAATYLTVQRP